MIAGVNLNKCLRSSLSADITTPEQFVRVVKVDLKGKYEQSKQKHEIII